MAAQLQPIKRKPGRPKRTIATAPTPKQAKILKTHTEHPDLSLREIAAVCETGHTHVLATLQRYGIDKQRVDAFKTHRGDILAGLQEKILNSVTDEDLKKAPFGSRVLAACQLYDKERLERDLSNFNVASVHADIAAMRNMVDNPGLSNKCNANKRNDDEM